MSRARILILEDDYYLAIDLRHALEAAGAAIVGPFADAGDAARALAADPPDCALVDLNLGDGISLALPRALARQAIPFAFVTGYDRAAIPDEFANVARVEKPVETRKAVELAARLLSPRE